MHIGTSLTAGKKIEGSFEVEVLISALPPANDLSLPETRNPTKIPPQKQPIRNEIKVSNPSSAKEG